MNLSRLGVTLVGSLALFLASEPTHADFSGDPYLDATLGSEYKIRAGGSSPGINNGGNVWKCGSSGALPNEMKCPNSASFTPAAATGGRQAWAVGIAPFNATEFELVCFVEWQFNPFIPWLFEPVLTCEFIPVVVAAGTVGRAMTILEWGSDNSATQAFSNEPTSLLAYNENLLDPCTPDVAGAQAGFDAGCILNFNHSHVPDNGYESDIRMTDPACDIPWHLAPLGGLFGERSHTSTDTQYNCLGYYSFPQMSNLPGSYRDTTYLDDEEEFNVGFGSSEAFALQAGTTYVTSQLFGSPVLLTSQSQPTLLGTSAKHEGAITTNIGTTILAATSCNVTGGLGCEYFTVKDAEVGGPANVFTQVIP